MLLDETPAPATGSAMADEKTPLVLDTWYVAAFSSDLVAGGLLARTLCNQRVVLYRDATGVPVALHDRCAHRSFPLSRGRIDGNALICGYHGFQYGSDGTCTKVPSQSSAPRGIGVRAYPVIEQPPLIWIWMGNPSAAADNPVPSPAWMRERSGWDLASGYLTLNASYVHMHENLLDLTHIGFLHEKSFGSPEYASAPFETLIDDTSIVVKRTVQPTFLPPVYANPLNMVDVPAARAVTSTFVSPGLSISAVALRNLSLPEDARIDHRAATAHLLTPIDANSIHYHFLIGRDFALGDEATSTFIANSLRSVFLEDQAALEAITDVRKDDTEPHADRSVASDKAGIAMRRLLARLARAEQLGSTGI